MADATLDATDPANCLYIQQPINNPYWLSTNVIMTTTNDPSFVETGPGVSNTTSVSVTWDGKEGCSLSQSDGIVTFDLFVSEGDPSLPMVHLTEGGTLETLVSTQLVSPISSGQTVATTVTWPATALAAIGTGHRCLLARVYPGNYTPPGVGEDLTTYPSNDTHYAQRNCHVAATDAGQMIIPIKNGNWQKEPQLVAIQVLPDLEPNRTVLDAIMPSLKLIPSFKQIAKTPLPRVELDLSPFKSHHESLLDKIEDWIKKEVIEIIEDLEGKCRHSGGVTARIALPPTFFAKFNLNLDLSGAKPGDAHIYHVSQVNGAGQPYGGLTVAIVRS